MQVGQALREARLNKGLDLYEVQRVTGIRVQQLRAMEEDRWDSVPEDEAEESLSAYADFLGLDADELRAEYRAPKEHRQSGASLSGAIRRGGSEPRVHWNPRAVMVVLAFAAVVGLIIGLVVVGPLGGSGGGGEGRVEGSSASSGVPATTTTTSTTSRFPVSLQLATKKVVWVCLLDGKGHPVINGENLAANQTVGPYGGDSFEVTFGNGSVDMTVNGQPVDVPPIAAPQGFRITPDGTTKLSGPDQPSCT